MRAADAAARSDDGERDDVTKAKANANARAKTKTTAPAPAPEPTNTCPSRGWWLLGAVCLLVSCAAASVLSLSHLGTPPPGCGPESACAKVTSSVWGRVPFIEWPTAFVGAAWFGGLLVGWLIARGRLGKVVWTLAALGGVMSLVLIGVMLVEGALCPWCLASHAGNLGFLGVALLSVGEVRIAAQPGGRRGVIALAGVSLAVTITLAVVDAQAKARDAAREEADRVAAVDEIIEAGRDAAAAEDPAADPTPDGGGDTDEPADPGADAGADAATPPDAPAIDGRPPFTGRWRLGPERAPIRFVVFLDYQCPDCRTVETELARLVRARDDVSLSIKHFPFNSTCNRLAASLNFNPHPNACWAARAAETAGILGGEDAFWEMHETLFARTGRFTDAQLPAIATEAGFDSSLFIRTMTSPLTLQRVQSDIEEGIALGLASTPMLFVNGVELGGWRLDGALERTINRLAEENLPRLSAAEAGDHPPTAADRYIGSWSTARRIPGPALAREPAAAAAAMFGGTSGGGTTVVVFGDLSDSQTRRVDARVRTRAERDGRVRYVFRHLPLDTDCNPSAIANRDTGGCIAARLAIAAGRLGGPEAARAAHRTLIAQPTPISPAAISAVAASTGLSPADLAAGIADPATDATLAEDIADAGVVRTGRRTVTVIVGGRIPSRLEYDSIDLLQGTIDRALSEN